MSPDRRGREAYEGPERRRAHRRMEDLPPVRHGPFTTWQWAVVSLFFVVTIMSIWIGSIAYRANHLAHRADLGARQAAVSIQRTDMLAQKTDALVRTTSVLARRADLNAKRGNTAICVEAAFLRSSAQTAEQAVRDHPGAPENSARREGAVRLRVLVRQLEASVPSCRHALK